MHTIFPLSLRGNDVHFLAMLWHWWSWTQSKRQTTLFLPVAILSMFGISVKVSFWDLPPTNSFHWYASVGPTFVRQYSEQTAANAKLVSTLTWVSQFSTQLQTSCHRHWLFWYANGNVDQAHKCWFYFWLRIVWKGKQHLLRWFKFGWIVIWEQRHLIHMTSPLTSGEMLCQQEYIRHSTFSYLPQV